MLALFTRGKPSLLGLDISSSSVKLLELSQQAPLAYRVENFAVASLPQNTIVDKNIINTSALAQTISRVTTEAHTKTKNVAIALPDSSTITKVLQVDTELGESDIEDHIAFEAGKYIPYTLEEVNLDFNVLGKSASDPNLLDVLLVSCRSDKIKTYAEATAEAGLTLKIVDVEAYAMERAYSLIQDQMPHHNAQHVIGIFNIGHDITTLTVLSNKQTIFSRETGFGGQQLITQIQQRYQLSAGQALEKLRQRTLPDDFEETILQPFKEALILHVRRAIQFFYSSSQHSEIHHLFLGGGVANIDGLAAMVSAQLSLSAAIANPFRGMSFAPRVNTSLLQHYASSMLICCGLALRKFEE